MRDLSLYHFHVTQIKRSAGQSAIASAAYRSGEKLYSQYYGETSDYTRKSGVVCAGILLPSHTLPEYADRETLWNSVEQSEKHPKAQLAYSFDIALQKEFTMEENIALVKQFLTDHFISRGMIADYAVHAPEKDGGITNPHFHVMCPIRPLNPDGTWGAKQKREYVLDEHGNRIRDGDGNYIFNAAKRKLKDHFMDNGKLPIRKWEKELESLKAEYVEENREMKKLERDSKNFRQIALMYMSVTAAENRNQQNKHHKLEHDK